VFLINVKRLLTIALNSISIFVACHYWKSQRKVREFITVVWKVITLFLMLFCITV